MNIGKDDALERLQVVSERRAAEITGLSEVHFRRMRKDGSGPRHVLLGQRRIGYRTGDVLDWIEARLSGAR